MSSYFDTMFSLSSPQLMSAFGEPDADVSIVLHDDTIAEELPAIFRNDGFVDDIVDASKVYRVRSIEMDVSVDSCDLEYLSRNLTDAKVIVGYGKHEGTAWCIREIVKRTDSYIRLALVDKPLRGVYTSGWYRT